MSRLGIQSRSSLAMHLTEHGPLPDVGRRHGSRPGPLVDEVERAGLRGRGGGERSRLYLPPSPEFSCKKLLAAGEERIFTLARVFRNRERSALHHPEFTML